MTTRKITHAISCRKKKTVVNDRAGIKTLIGNDAIYLSKELSGKNGSKLAQRYPTNAHADV